MEKNYWTEDDFEEMTWHDSRLYAIAFGTENHEIIFDIDYILNWVPPIENETNYKFLVVPATLVFRNVYNLSINFAYVDAIIDEITRDYPNKPKNSTYIKDQLEYDWTIITVNGEISFKSVGYNQFARKKPILLDTQTMDVGTRGGISFNLLNGQVFDS